MDNNKSSPPKRKCLICQSMTYRDGIGMWCNEFDRAAGKARRFGGPCGPQGRHWHDDIPQCAAPIVPPEATAETASFPPPEAADMAQLPDDHGQQGHASRLPGRIGYDVSSYGRPDYLDFDEDTPPVDTNRLSGCLVWLLFLAITAASIAVALHINERGL